jgi:hypothetical protein
VKRKRKGVFSSLFTSSNTSNRKRNESEINYKKQNGKRGSGMKARGSEKRKTKEGKENITCTPTLGYTSPTLGYSSRTPAALLYSYISTTN